eukprot:5496631-Pleurochrysis_carterae.AAC.2
MLFAIRGMRSLRTSVLDSIISPPPNCACRSFQRWTGGHAQLFEVALREDEIGSLSVCQAKAALRGTLISPDGGFAE